MGRPVKSRTKLVVIPVLVLVLLVAAGLPLYVFPPPGHVGSADLAYVLGPAQPDRIALAEQLRDQGVVSQILVSVGPFGAGPTAKDLPVCRKKYVTCDVPDPLKTRGEAAMLGDYAATHTVHRTVVITFAPQVMRARFIFAKCYSGDTSVVSVDEHLRLREWAYQYVYQTAGFLKAFVKACPQ